MTKTRGLTARSTAFVEAAKSQSGAMSTIKDSNDEALMPSAGPLARVVARHGNDSSARINDIAARARLNVIEGRQIAAPPWSAACMTGHGPSECGEPMWIYGSRGEITRYRNAF